MKDGRPAEYAFRLAVTMLGGVQGELIQPLDDRSTYAEFLNTKGEGLHHVAVGVRGDCRETLDTLTAKGHRCSGRPVQRPSFAYVPTEGQRPRPTAGGQH